MILLVYYHPVISATWNCQLSHKRGITFSAVNDYVNTRRFSSLVLSPVPSQQQKWAKAQRERTKTVKTQGLKWAQPLARGNPEKDQRKIRKKGGGAGSSMEPPAAVPRSHARGARRQPQFTKRHLFHYSNALWLITSWPVCEMTATYSPVNRKICTCSIRGVGEQRSGAAKGKEKRQEKTQEITFSGETALILLAGIWWETVFRLGVQRP